MSNSNVRCSRCGRRLKNPKTIAVGMGKICEAKDKLEKARLDAEHQDRLDKERKKLGIVFVEDLAKKSDLEKH